MKSTPQHPPYDPTKFIIGLCGVGFLILVVLTVVIPVSMFSKECRARGGDVMALHNNSPLCVSNDGRLIRW